MQQTTPATIGRYEVQREIGRGAMGVVYLASDPVLHRAVALKTVNVTFALADEERAAFETRFMAEARAAAGLSHPGIVTIYDVGRDPGTGILYIAMEYLEGRTLEETISREGPVDWVTSLGIVESVAEALHHAHGRGIVHRDVKPANIMVLPSGATKVMDFGVAKLATESLTSAGQFFGTPSYMSPEHVSGDPVDARSDLFSLGAVMYALLTGKPAFEGDTVAATFGRILYRRPVPPSQVVPGLPPATDAIVARALAVDPAARFPDGASLAAAVRASREGGRSPPPPRVVSDAPRPRRAWGRTSAIAGGATVLALGLAAVIPRAGLIAAPAPLEIEFEHPLRSGMLKVWVDDELRAEEPLESRVKEDLVVVQTRIGRESITIEVPSGEHDVRLEVEGDGFRGSRTLQGTFESGVPRRLNARVSGLLKKELSAWWSR